MVGNRQKRIISFFAILLGAPIVLGTVYLFFWFESIYPWLVIFPVSIILGFGAWSIASTAYPSNNDD